MTSSSDEQNALFVTDSDLLQLAQSLAQRALAHEHRIVTAESCTGGWIAKLLTDLAGSSTWFDAGIVTYSNQAKAKLLGVDDKTLKQYGAVSLAVVEQMAMGALSVTGGTLSVAVSGIAGPGGGSAEKPVGMVCFAWGLAGAAVSSKIANFKGSREQIRREAVKFAVQGLINRASTQQ